MQERTCYHKSVKCNIEDSLNTSNTRLSVRRKSIPGKTRIILLYNTLYLYRCYLILFYTSQPRALDILIKLLYVLSI